MTVISFAPAASAPATAASLFNFEGSTLNFTAVERPLLGVGRKGEGLPVSGYKGIYVSRAGKPVNVGVVGSDYKLVQHKDVFPVLEQALVEAVRPDLLVGATATDKMAHDGGWALREYVLPAFGGKIVSDNGWSTKVGFRVIGWNSLDGSASMGLLTGLIDFFCTNGIVTGTNIVKTMRRHTKGLCVRMFADQMRNAVEKVQADVRRYETMANTRMDREKVRALLEDRFSARRAAQLLEQVDAEARVRGHNLFAVHSALTFYSSHNSEAFPIRDTGSDHAARTLHQRELEVAAIVNPRAFIEQLAA